MFDFKVNPALPKNELYRLLRDQTRALVDGEHDFIANAANLSALLWMSLPEINWVGIYRLKVDSLVLGPFQGKPACVRIGLGKGVCGTAALKKQSILVPDVQKFPGHIACDSQTRSELVVPLKVCDDLVLGVLDIDSPIPNRFDSEDQLGIENLAGILTGHLTNLLNSDL